MERYLDLFARDAPELQYATTSLYAEMKKDNLWVKRSIAQFTSTIIMIYKNTLCVYSATLCCLFPELQDTWHCDNNNFLGC